MDIAATQRTRAEPAEIVERLNGYFERMVDAIENEGGVVDKFIGDAVMAVFGGVFTDDDGASRALRAAEAMRHALKDLNNTRHAGDADIARRADDIDFDNGIGLHTGEVIQGPLGASGRKEFTVIGDAVNTASRIESLTKEKGAPILLTRAVVDKLTEKERVRLRAMGSTKVKGKDEIIEIFTVDS